MRAIRSITLGFGMVSIPVKVYKSVDDRSISFASLHTECQTRIKMPKYCPTCDRQVEASEILKAYPLDEKGGHYVPVTNEELQTLPLSSIKTIQVDGFVKTIEDPRWFDTPYVLAPDEVGVKAFVLFTKAMAELGVIGVAKTCFREGREHLCAIRPTGDGCLLLQTMHWGDELRDYGDIIPFADVSEKEMEMAKALIAALSGEVDLYSYKDEYRQALVELISAKIEGKTIEVAVAEPKRQEGDLVEQLMASLQAVGAGK